MPRINNHREQHGRTAVNNTPKSPTMLELRQLAAAGTTSLPNNDDNAHDDDNDDSSSAASEESNPIIWEDDAGTDLRHLFSRRNNNDENSNGGELLPTMTQQVDEMLLNMDDSDDDSDDKIMTGSNAHIEQQQQHLTPPPAAATRSGRNRKLLLDSGDVPATISKLKRRRRESSSTSNIHDGNNNEARSNEDCNKLEAKQLLLPFNHQQEPLLGDGEKGPRRHYHSLSSGELNNGQLPRMGSRSEEVVSKHDNMVNDEGGDDDDNGVENLLKEIEQSLDQQQSSSLSCGINLSRNSDSNNNSSSDEAAHNTSTTNNIDEVDNDSYDFDNDDEEIEYMRTVPCPMPSGTAESSSNNEMTIQKDNDSYAFLDNDGDDDEWANFEPTQQCPATNADEDVSIDFDDDDIDFAAVDKQIEDRLEKIGKSNFDAVPPPNAPIHNRRCGSIPNNQLKAPLFLSFTRYVVRRVKDDLNTYTKTLDVSLWTPQEEKGMEGELERLKKICSTDDLSANVSQIDGCIHLRGEWYHTNAKSGDVIHLCSISGSYRTDLNALPVILHSNPPTGSDAHDDLLLVLHPDELITPTLISEAVKCPRLAVLQSRLGSTGLSAKSAVVGTLRHDLFERCLREKDSSRRSAALFTREIIRHNAEALVGCGLTDRKEAFGEVMKTLPQIQSFLDTYTAWNSTKKGQEKATTKHGGALLKGMFPPCDASFSIDEVSATEEWALVPELGLKGNVDATISGRLKPATSSSGDSDQDALVPLELKTGHNQNPQHNHLAQLSVYTIMLRARHGTALYGDNSPNDVTTERGAASSGMLLYLNDRSFCAKHVKPSLSDIKTLVGQRNGIVTDVLTAAQPRGIALQYDECKKAKVIVNEPPPPSALPPLISNTSSCERCYKNRECMMFAVSPNVPRTNLPHRNLIDHFTGHLNEADLEYFRKWDRLIDLERHATPSDIAKSWLYDSEEKETSDGKCISSLILDDVHLSASLVKTKNAASDGDATIRFCRSPESKSKQPITNLHFEKGTYVIIRTDESPMCQKRRQRILIFRGSVTSTAEASIDVVLQQKDVSRLSRKSTYRIDRDELSNGAGLLLQNLVNFFTLDIPPFSTEALGQSPLKMKQLTQNTDSSARRRRLTNCIIRLDPPPRFNDMSEEDLFSEDFSFIDLVAGCDRSSLKQDFAKLNSDQKAAVLKVISAEDFALVQGLPGTGKSATIAFLTRLLVARGKRVLITSYTHAAVDHLLSKLIKSGMVSSEFVPNPIVRIGRPSSCHASVHALLAQNIACKTEMQESSAATAFMKPNADVLFNVVTSARVVGVSALTAPRSPLLAGQKFDVVIVDEAGQISQPAVLGAIMAADSFVLVGDHMQLPPLVVSDVADQAGYGTSMLMHLARGFPDAVAKLTMQYRMNEEICLLSNIVAYKGLLKCANDEVKNQRLNLSSRQETNHPKMKWIEKVVDPNEPVVFLDCAAKESQGPVNNAEISIVEQCVKSLSNCGVKMSSIGVITPFRSQLRALTDKLNIMCNDGLEISTIDRFQGRDKSSCIISLVRSNSEGKAGRLLQDFRRLNVAFSRAKHKMIVIGSYSTLHKGSDILRPVLESCHERGWIHHLPQSQSADA